MIRFSRVRGVTLIELLVVLAIAGLLTALLLPMLGPGISSTELKGAALERRHERARDAAAAQLGEHQELGDVGAVRLVGRRFAGELHRTDQPGAAFGDPERARAVAQGRQHLVAPERLRVVQRVGQDEVDARAGDAGSCLLGLCTGVALQKLADAWSELERL